jgi:hypothetical protein
MFEKSTCDKYTIYWDKDEWAIITIDENGLFSCQTKNFGKYQYKWFKDNRRSFKYFLLDTIKDPLNLLSKVSSKTSFDYNKSLKKWKKVIIQTIKNGNCTKEQAQKAWEFFLGHAKRTKKLHKAINIAGSIYNHLIALHKRYYRMYGRSLNVFRRGSMSIIINK